MSEYVSTPTTPRILSLAQAARECPTGPVSPVAVWRWATKGVLNRSGHRVYLRTLKCGRKLATTPEMLWAFFEAAGSTGEAV